MRAKLFKISSLCLLLLAASSCASNVVLRHQLYEQILRPRVGHKGLTNRACDRQKDGKCLEITVKEYLFEDPAFRQTANELEFICKVGGKRYKICQDKPGLCRITYEKNCNLFGCKSTRLESYLPGSRYQFLLDAKTVCFSRKSYDWGAIK